MSLAPALANYLIEIAIEDRAFAYLHVTADGHLLDWGGEIASYHLQDLQPGDAIETHLFFLAGFLPLAAETEVLPGIHTETGRIVDVHLISERQEGWVLLLDATAAVEQQQRLQQKGNDLSLLRHQYNKLLHQCLAWQQSAVPEAAQEPPIASKQKDISVLLVRICDLTRYSQQTTPAATLRTLNAYISAIAQVIVEEGGVINHILGETAVALFGLLPGQQPVPRQAVCAARRIAQKFQGTADRQVSATEATLGVGSCITTGQATAGLIRNQGQSSPNAIGNHIYHATQLSAWLTPGSLLIDGPTFEALADWQRLFEATPPPTQVGLSELYSLASSA